MREALCPGRGRPRAEFGVVMEKAHCLASCWLLETSLARKAMLLHPRVAQHNWDLDFISKPPHKLAQGLKQMHNPGGGRDAAGTGGCVTAVATAAATEGFPSHPRTWLIPRGVNSWKQGIISRCSLLTC